MSEKTVEDTFLRGGLPDIAGLSGRRPGRMTKEDRRMSSTTAPYLRLLCCVCACDGFIDRN